MTSTDEEIRPGAMASPGRRSSLAWVAASVAGWAIGGMVGDALGSSWSPPKSGAVVVAVGATLAGAAQWVVLRRSLPHAHWWIAATAAAVAVVAGLVWVIEPLDAGSGVAIGGIVLGGLQWMVLRRHVSRAGWWVPTSAIGWVLGGVMSGGFGPPLGWAVIGVIYGAVTGPVLMWLLRRRHS